jgi:protocatechuate 3,4-dioxygenase beta subunit
MRALLRFAVLSLIGLGVARAQPMPKEELRKIPPSEAVVLNPPGVWVFTLIGGDARQAYAVGMEQAGGTPRMTVAEPGKRAYWTRRLAIPFNLRRYPIAVLTYRATGILPDATSLLRLKCAGTPSITTLQNSDLIDDGEVHETMVDLRELGPLGIVRSLELGLHCRGPAPATFELLGLRFESDHDLPPPEQGEEPVLSLRVVDREGKAVAAAKVTVDGERLNAMRSATTDADGRVTVRAMSNPEGEHSVRIAKPGMAAVEVTTSQKGGLSETVTLPRAARYGGVVQNEAGKPVPGASVNLDLRSPSPMWVGRRFHSVTVLTDAEGRWRTPVLPAEGISVSVDLTHPSYMSSPSLHPPLGDMKANRAVLVLRSGACLRGRIVDPDGTPVAGVRLALAKEIYHPKREVTKTDREGRFAFTQCLVGQKLLSVVPKGLAPAWIKVNMTAGMEDLEVRLKRGRPLRGRVIDHEGKPIAGVRVRRYSAMSIATWSDKTDADGRFVWHHAPGAETSPMTLSKKGYMELWDCLMFPSDKEATVVLPPVLRVRGEVTDAETGQLVPNCTVTPGSATRKDRSSRHGQPRWDDRQAKPPADGRYELQFARAQYDSVKSLKVTAAGYTTGSIPSIPLDGGDCKLDIQLRRGAGPRGVVYLPDGKPASGAKVYLVEAKQMLALRNRQDIPPTNCRSVATGADGRYAFPSAIDSWVLVAIHREGYAEMGAGTYAKSPDVRLQTWGKLEGTCRIGGELAGERECILTPSDSGQTLRGPRIQHTLSAKVDGQGRFAFPKVPPGKGRVASPVVSRGEASFALCQTAYSVAPGATIRVSLGGGGRPIIGRVDLPRTGNEETPWEAAIGNLGPSFRPDIERPQIPAEFRELPSRERMERLAQWLKTDASKAYRDARRRREEAYAAASQSTIRHSVLPKPDGSFRIDGVSAGSYQLHIGFRSKAAGRQWVDCIKDVEVPKMPDGRSDEPLDLGILVLGVRK